MGERDTHHQNKVAMSTKRGIYKDVHLSDACDSNLKNKPGNPKALVTNDRATIKNAANFQEAQKT